MARGIQLPLNMPLPQIGIKKNKKQTDTKATFHPPPQPLPTRKLFLSQMKGKTFLLRFFDIDVLSEFALLIFCATCSAYSALLSTHGLNTMDDTAFWTLVMVKPPVRVFRMPCCPLYKEAMILPLFICFSFCPSVCLPFFLYFFQSFCLFVFLLVCLSF